MDEIPVAPETANAVQAESATATQEATAAATPESAPAKSEQPTQQEAPKTTEESGSEPEKEPEAVRELKSQRRKRQEAEQEAAYWKSEALKQQQAAKPAEQTTQSDPNVPRIENFENYDDFVVAKTKYEIKKEAEERQAAERQVEVNTAYSKRFAEAEKKYPDLAETIQTAQIPMPQPIIEAIKEADAGPEMAYHLAKHPEEAEGLARLAKANPWAAMRELGKLEMKLKMPVAPAQTRQVTQAPEPIRPVGTGTAGLEKSLDEMSTAEFIAKRNAQTFVKVGGRLVPKS